MRVWTWGCSAVSPLLALLLAARSPLTLPPRLDQVSHTLLPQFVWFPVKICLFYHCEPADTVTVLFTIFFLPSNLHVCIRRRPLLEEKYIYCPLSVFICLKICLLYCFHTLLIHLPSGGGPAASLTCWGLYTCAAAPVPLPIYLCVSFQGKLCKYTCLNNANCLFCTKLYVSDYFIGLIIDNQCVLAILRDVAHHSDTSVCVIV